MTRLPDNLAAQLIAQQPLDAAALENYHHAIDTMFIQKLSPARRAHLALRVLFGLAVAAYFAWDLALHHTQPLDRLIINAAIILVALVWSAYLARDLVKGAMDHRQRTKLQSLLQLGLILLIAAVTFIAAAAAPDVPQATRILAAGALFLIVASLLHLRGLLRRARMDLHQRTLELQLHLATLAEQINKQK